MKLHDICLENNVSFWFKQTGSKFVKEGTLFTVKRQFQHSQARKAGINFKAGFYQTFAALFGASLKKQYDPTGDDALTERVILLVESGQL